MSLPSARVCPLHPISPNPSGMWLLISLHDGQWYNLFLCAIFFVTASRPFFVRPTNVVHSLLHPLSFHDQMFSHLFEHRTASSHSTVTMRVQINSAGAQEDAPCTNASYACTGSLLKGALKIRTKRAPSTPKVLRTHHGTLCPHHASRRLGTP